MNTIAQLKAVWEKHYTKDKFDYVFADQQFNRQYESETRYSRFYLWLTLLSISIASIGLYGLILFYLVKREKEIGIRKINGATIAQVMNLLNLEISKWVAVAFIIAVPVAWYAMHTWLQNFSYKTSLTWWIFIVCGLVVFAIALLTVSWQSWRAATRNPVEALRYE